MWVRSVGALPDAFADGFLGCRAITESPGGRNCTFSVKKINGAWPVSTGSLSCALRNSAPDNEAIDRGRVTSEIVTAIYFKSTATALCRLDFCQPAPDVPVRSERKPDVADEIYLI